MFTGWAIEAWRKCFQIRVLADAGFSTTEWMPQAQQLGFEVSMGVRVTVAERTKLVSRVWR